MKRILFGLTILIILVVALLASPKIINSHESIEQLSDIAKLREVMKQNGIRKTVIHGIPMGFLHFKEGQKLDLANTTDNHAVILEAIQAYPEQFEFVCSIDPQQADRLDQLTACTDSGAVGAKIYLGYTYSHQARLDDPRFMPLYEAMATQGLLLILPVNTAEYQQELENILIVNPTLKVLVPHYALSSKSLDRLTGLLDSYPNLYVDTSFGHIDFAKDGFQTISNNHEAFHEFYVTYADRILFGTNNVMTTYEDKEAVWFSALTDDYLSFLREKEFVSAIDPAVTYQGLDLPMSVLKKVLWKNWELLTQPQ